MLSNTTINIGVELLSGEKCIYYMELRGKYYKINFFQDKVISINIIPSLIQESNKPKYNLNANPVKDLITIENINENFIEIKSGNSQGEDEIIIKYGDITKSAILLFQTKLEQWTQKTLQENTLCIQQEMVNGIYASSPERDAEIVSLLLGIFSLNNDVKIVFGSGIKEDPFIIKDN